MRHFEVTETKPKLAGLEWREKYGCYSTVVNGWLELSFGYEKDGYHISIAGRTLKVRGKDPVDAARIAVEAARLKLSKALDGLKGE